MLRFNLRKYLLLGLICLNGVLFAQMRRDLEQRVCATANPMGPFPVSLRAGNHVSLDSLDNIATLPVIIHIIHQGSEIGKDDNLPESSVFSQLEVLQEDFRRIPGTFGFNDHPSGADTEIEFCLAQLDPEGLPMEEPGIHRINALDRNWTSPPYTTSYIDSLIKPQTIWDPQRYVNIWVLDLEDFRGLAQFPDSSGLVGLDVVNGVDSTDGIVIDLEEWGKFAQNSGRTVTHEMGHFLGLNHTWGNSNDCEVDDGCDDTPFSDGPTLFCDVGKTTCGSLDMIENYMDLTVGSCQNIFTQCQKTRMRTVLLRSPRRKSLTYSPVCKVPFDAPQALFTFSFLQTDGCSNQLQFYDQSENDPFEWAWDFGNGMTSTEPDPLIKYETPGVYNVTLEVSNFQGRSTFSREIVVCVLDPVPPVLSPNSYTIFPVHPNPAEEAITVKAWFPRPVPLQVQLVDLRGRTIASIFNGVGTIGSWEHSWNIPSFLESGVYVIHWLYGDNQKVQKVILSRE